MNPTNLFKGISRSLLHGMTQQSNLVLGQIPKTTQSIEQSYFLRIIMRSVSIYDTQDYATNVRYYVDTFEYYAEDVLALKNHSIRRHTLDT